MDMKKNVQPTVVWSLLGGIAILVLLAIFIQFGYIRLTKNSGGAEGTVSLKEAVLVLDYGNGEVRKFKGPIEENARAWDLFQQAIAVGGISAEITDHFVPQDIDGFKNGKDKKQWNLYVNNVKQKFTPFEVKVKPGDEVIFRFEQN